MRITRLKLLILVVMSLFGLAAALEVFASYYYLRQTPPGCTTGGFYDCDKVLGSTYSQIFGIPLELFAVAYFVVNLALVYLVAFGSEGVFRRAIRALFGWRFLGLLLVPYLVIIELFILHAVCIYCTMMHVAIVADFIIISYLLFYKGGIGTLEGEPGTMGDADTPLAKSPSPVLPESRQNTPEPERGAGSTCPPGSTLS